MAKRHSSKDEISYEKEPLSSSQMKPKKKPQCIYKKHTEKFVPPDKRCEKCFYWRDITGFNQSTFCCHYALDTGKLRDKISRTECGSFLDKKNAPKRKPTIGEVPMTQWGCGGVMYRSNGFD